MAAAGLTVRGFGPSAMETMARPQTQWYYNESEPSRPGPRSDYSSNQDEQWIPRSERPSNSPLTLVPPRGPPSCFSRRDSSQSSHASSPTSLRTHSPPYSTARADLSYSPETSPPPFYHYPCPPSQVRHAISDRFDMNVVRAMGTQQLPVDSTPTTNRHDPAKALPPHSLAPFHASPFHASTPGSSQQNSATQSVSFLTRMTHVSWQHPRTAMPVSSLLNEESSSGAPAMSSNRSAEKSPVDSIKYELRLRQQPVHARSCGFGDRDRRVIDPPPILQLDIQAPHLSRDVISQMLRSQLNVVQCSIWSADGTEDMSAMSEESTRQKRLMGNLVATPFYGTDENGDFGSFFCFPDISCRTPGRYRLKFRLVVVNPRLNSKAPIRSELLSEVFQTFTAKEFPGMSESSALAKALRSQGCNIPTKKGNEKSGRREDSDEHSDAESHQRKRIRSNQ